jgi:hypothetical protein
MPSRPEWQATPWAWLPADIAITPTRAWSGVRFFNLLSAPRSLNEPVYCRFSSFSRRLLPRRSDRRGAAIVGVNRICPAKVTAAARMSSKVTLMVVSSAHATLLD